MPTKASTRASLQVATDALQAIEKAMDRDKIKVNDRQLACTRISSKEGQHYLAAMACAANFAWVNRSCMTHMTRQAFAKQFKQTPEQLQMHVVYDVSHNIAKVWRPPSCALASFRGAFPASDAQASSCRLPKDAANVCHESPM